MDPRAGVTPSIRNFAHAIDRQRQALERIPLLDVTRLVQAATSTHMAACVACANAAEIAQAGAARAPVVVLDHSDLHLPVPPRTLVLVRSFSPEARGRADAALDPGLTDAASFRRALEEEDR